jgi:hypothetical protein
MRAANVAISEDERPTISVIVAAATVATCRRKSALKAAPNR